MAKNKSNQPKSSSKKHPKNTFTDNQTAQVGDSMEDCGSKMK